MGFFSDLSLVTYFLTQLTVVSDKVVRAFNKLRFAQIVKLDICKAFCQCFKHGFSSKTQVLWTSWLGDLASDLWQKQDSAFELMSDLRDTVDLCGKWLKLNLIFY